MFNPARSDFHTLCMHDHPAGFTWGNTAASTVAVLPEDGFPYLWWAATTPCTSVYVPVAAAGYRLPPELEAAGLEHGAGPHPEHVRRDSHLPGSYWWTFQTLLEAVAGDGHGASYRERQPVVRARFDALQRAWLDEVAGLSDGGSAGQWDELTPQCVGEALDTARELVRGFEPVLGV